MSDSVEVNVNVDQIGASASEGTARDHKILMDRPEAKGGENLGAMGGESLLMSLGGCFMSNLLAAVKSRESSVTDVTLSITGTLENAPSRFTAVEMKIEAGYTNRGEMEKLVTIAERGCIVANTLKNAVELQIALV